MGVSEVEILPPGTVVGDTYEIVREIATGGMGTVYEARNVRLSASRVAVKVLSKLTTRSAELLPRFRREAEIGASLNHPNIIRVMDWNTLPDGLPFFVMEYLEGESLASYMTRNLPKVDLRLALHIVEHTAAALFAAHQQGVIHRDLKPSNIYLSGVGLELPFIKVLDFGISKLIFDETLETTSKLLGTPRYMSPEQVRSKPLDPNADQFALATITYELCCGRNAFPGKSLEAILYHVVHDEPEPLEKLNPALPQHLISAIRRGMAKKPDERFANVQTFVRALKGQPENAPAVQTSTPDAPEEGTLELEDLARLQRGDTLPPGEESPAAPQNLQPIKNTPEVLGANSGSIPRSKDDTSSEEQDKPPIGNRTLMFALIGTLVMASILAAYTLYLSQDPPRKTAVQKVKPLTQTQPQDVPTPNEVPDTDPPLNNTNDTVAPDPLPETSPDVVPPEPNKTTPKLPPREPAKVAKRLDEAETKLSA
ncbi:MAG: serine/threonine-protein kinase, partial [Myxococcota bacterium]